MFSLSAIETRAWMINYIWYFYVGVIIFPPHKLYNDLANLLVKSTTTHFTKYI